MNRPKDFLFALFSLNLNKILSMKEKNVSLYHLIKCDKELNLLILIGCMFLCSLLTCSLSPVHSFFGWHPPVDSATVQSSHCLIPPGPASTSCSHAEDESNVLCNKHIGQKQVWMPNNTINWSQIVETTNSGPVLNKKLNMYLNVVILKLNRISSWLKTNRDHQWEFLCFYYICPR